MNISLLEARNPVWGNAANTAITLECKFSHFPDDWIPFRAQQNDSEAHGADIFTRASGGEFGTVAAYVKPQAEINEEAFVAKNAADAAAAKQDAKLAAFQAMTLPQIRAHVAAVSSLAQAKDVMETMAIALWVLARRL